MDKDIIFQQQLNLLKEEIKPNDTIYFKVTGRTEIRNYYQVFIFKDKRIIDITRSVGEVCNFNFSVVNQSLTIMPAFEARNIMHSLSHELFNNQYQLGFSLIEQSFPLLNEGF